MLPCTLLKEGSERVVRYYKEGSERGHFKGLPTWCTETMGSAIKAQISLVVKRYMPGV